MPRTAPLISAVICTCNPNEFVMGWVLDCLSQQTLSPSQFEVVVVDNNSRTPLDAERLTAGRPLRLRVVHQSLQGLVFARCKGIQEAASPLLAFVDDDNGLAANYLENAVRIARDEPEVGAFGGITRLLTDLRIPEWKRGLMPYLGVRDYGPAPITSRETHWGEWEPIGAGMVVRRDVALRYTEVVESNPEAQLLSRRGGNFIAGEDTLLARLAYEFGYACSYQPSLCLTHFIKGARMDVRHLARTIYGVAQGYVINERLCGRPPREVSWFAAAVELAARFRYRVRQKGWGHGAVEWFWDLGYFRQVRASARMGRPATVDARHHSASIGA